RAQLLQPAGGEIPRCPALSGVDRLGVRVVSGRHCRTSRIVPADHVVVASVASLARNADVRERLLESPNLFVVIDEAHHAPAKSYRDILRQLGRQKRFRVLGLTATPTRTAAGERPLLSQLFAGNILYNVDTRRLIERGTLSRPLPVRVATHTDVEAGMTDGDRAHIARFNELSEELLDKIARIAPRNAVIIEHYLQERSRYGKTL